MVSPAGFEPATPGLEELRISEIDYHVFRKYPSTHFGNTLPTISIIPYHTASDNLEHPRIQS